MENTFEYVAIVALAAVIVAAGFAFPVITWFAAVAAVAALQLDRNGRLAGHVAMVAILAGVFAVVAFPFVVMV